MKCSKYSKCSYYCCSRTGQRSTPKGDKYSVAKGCTRGDCLDDRKYVELTANDLFFSLFLSGQSSKPIFDLGGCFLRDLVTTGIHGVYCTGTGRHGNRSHGNYVAIMGIHGIVCTGNGLHGKSSRGNRPPRELATTRIRGIASIRYLLAQKASTIGSHRM